MSHPSVVDSIEEICVLAVAAYFLSRGPIFGRLLLYRASLLDKAKAFLFFVLLSLVDVVLPGVRTPHSGIIAAVTAGLLLGPPTGLAVGATVWLTELAVGRGPVNGGIGASLGALMAGWAFYFRPRPSQQALVGFLAGVFGQTIWRTAGRWVSDPTSIEAVTPWQSLMTLWSDSMAVALAGGVGVLFFLMILRDLKTQQDRVAREQIGRAFAIANGTLPHLRHGLTEESAKHIVEIIRSVSEVGAVGLSDGQRMLAYTGAGADHHFAGDPVFPKVTLDASTTDRTQVVIHDRAQLGCRREDCPLSSGLVSPLYHAGKVIGWVHLYSTDGRPATEDVIGLGVGIAQFLSRYQMELADLERQTQVAAQAELRALQAQVHPHFLFNVLNTMAALSEIDPPSAGRLAVRLGDFLRRGLRESPPPLITLAEELSNARSYLDIETTRFREALKVDEEIEPGLEEMLVPSFGLQILVENAVLHGISQKPGGGVLSIRVAMRRGNLWLRVADNGAGMPPERWATLFDASASGRAGGLAVLFERCRRMYGGNFRIRAFSKKGVGTVVALRVPAMSVAEPDTNEVTTASSQPAAETTLQLSR